MHALMQLQTILLTLQHVIGKITSLGTVERSWKSTGIGARRYQHVIGKIKSLGTVERPWKSTGICASRMPSYHQEVTGGHMELGGS